MNRLLQGWLLGMYRGARRSGILATGPGNALFECAYWAYKSVLEAGDIEPLRHYVAPGRTVIDVGANLGFFTLHFARWTGPGGRVIAIEAEQHNFLSLARRVERAGYASIVTTVHAAAAERSGELRLALNADNPADHRLAAAGVAVRATTVDALVEATGWQAVSLIKIDVQGAEGRVLAGAAGTLRRFRPALFLEIDGQGLQFAGSSAAELLRQLQDEGYRPHALERGGVSAALAPGAVEERVRARGYADFLFLAA